MRCTCYLATPFSAVHKLWITNVVSLYQTMKQRFPKIPQCPLSSSCSLFFICPFFILEILFRDHYTQLPHFKDYKIEAQKA